MKTLTSAVAAESVKNETTPIRLFEIGGDPILYFTDADKNVVYNGQTYISKGISYSKGKSSLGGEVDQHSVVIDNFDSGMIAWVAGENPTGHYSKIMKGFWSGSVDGGGNLTLVDDSAVILFWGRNTAINIDNEFELIIKSSLDLHGQIGPKSMQDVTCRFKGANGFRGPNCQYAGAETTCNYTIARCRELQNQLNFGGFAHLNEKMNT